MAPIPPSRTAPRSRPLAAGAAWLVVSGLGLVPAAVIAARPSDPHAVAAVFPPWWSAGRAFAAAASAGRLAAVGTVPWIIVVRGDGDTAAQLKSSGALVLLDPRALLGCAPKSMDVR